MKLWALIVLVVIIAVTVTVQAPAPVSPPEGLVISQEFEPPVGKIHSRHGVYLTAHAVAQPGFLAQVLENFSAFGLDAVVIDIKDMHGEVHYATEVGLAHHIGAVAPILDIPAILKQLHERGIYAIARQVVFYDPFLSRYLGSPAAPWVLPTISAAVEYNLAIAKEVEELGFDELQFDYVRFPDDGPIGPNYENRARAVEAFLATVQARLSIPISVDVYGRVMWPWNAQMIDPIGQCLEGISKQVDIISPMLYPSHYVEQALKDDPYGTVRLALEHGKARVKTPLRPFLQAFDMAIPQGMTLAQYINAQIRAAEEMGADGYLFWNPRSDYTALWTALRSLGR